MNYWHSTKAGCEIYPDKKSFSRITERYSRHYCKTHKVTLGHQANIGASQEAWQLHFYAGTASITDLATYQKLQDITHEAARVKKERRQHN